MLVLISQGNNWDGRVTLVSTETSASIDKTVVSGVSAVASSNSSGNVFVGRDDGNLSIYSDSLDEVTTISAHDDIITAVSVNPFNDAQCVTVCWDGKIGLLDCDTDQIDVFYGHSGIINGVTHNRKQPGVFSTIGQDGFLRLWDSRSASEGCTNLLPLCQIGSTCCWSSQSEFLIACGLEDGGLVVADIRTNNLVSLSTSHSGRITKIVCPNSSNKFNDNVDEFFIRSSVDKSICTQKFENIESDCFR
jgi:WD40 repeat protein